MSDRRYQASIARGLDAALARAVRRQWDARTDRIIVFSDLHRGQDDHADDFRRLRRDLPPGARVLFRCRLPADHPRRCRGALGGLAGQGRAHLSRAARTGEPVPRGRRRAVLQDLGQPRRSLAVPRPGRAPPRARSSATSTSPKVSMSPSTQAGDARSAGSSSSTATRAPARAIDGAGSAATSSAGCGDPSNGSSRSPSTPRPPISRSAANTTAPCTSGRRRANDLVLIAGHTHNPVFVSKPHLRDPRARPRQPQRRTRPTGNRPNSSIARSRWAKDRGVRRRRRRTGAAPELLLQLRAAVASKTATSPASRSPTARSGSFGGPTEDASPDERIIESRDLASVFAGLDREEAVMAVSAAARDLHAAALVIDAHVHPSLKTYLFKKKLHKTHRSGGAFNPFTMRVDLPKTTAGGVDGIVSSIYLPEGGLLGDCKPLKLLSKIAPKRIRRLFKGDPFERTIEILDAFEAAVDEANGRGRELARVVRSTDQIRQAKSRRRDRHRPRGRRRTQPRRHGSNTSKRSGIAASACSPSPTSTPTRWRRRWSGSRPRCRS